MTAQAHLLPDGRLHLNHGPIDLIIGAWGTAAAVRNAFDQAQGRFVKVLDELVAELPALRSGQSRPVRGPIARCMGRAVACFRPGFITPMAAVAGAVADDVLAHMTSSGLTKAYVNNGGDIALLLEPGQSFSVAIIGREGVPDRATIRSDDAVRGIATSGWRGRSFSLGIADAVTVLARTAAMADAAATVIANAVNLPDHPAISRRPACDIKIDSDLGRRPVTTGVARLTRAERDRALHAGLVAARAALERGLIEGAALFLQGEVRTIGIPSAGFQLWSDTRASSDRTALALGAIPHGGRTHLATQQSEPCNG